MKTLRAARGAALAMAYVFGGCVGPGGDDATGRSTEALTATECAAQGGVCDASNQCVRFTRGPDRRLVQQVIGTCEPDAPQDAGVGGGPAPGAPAPIGSFYITDVAYIPRTLPGSTSYLGSPCQGSPDWQRLSSAPATSGDDALRFDFNVWREPSPIALYDYYFAGDQREHGFELGRRGRVRSRVLFGTGASVSQRATVLDFRADASPSHRYLREAFNQPRCVHDIRTAPVIADSTLNGARVDRYATRAESHLGSAALRYDSVQRASYPFDGFAPGVQNRQTARIWTDAFGAVSVELQLQHYTFPNHDTVLQFTHQGVTRTYGIYRYQTSYTGPGIFSLNAPAPTRTIVFSITPTGAVRFNGNIVQPNTWMVVAS